MIPLSLYIHLPWCVKKCPYCDFNSHALRASSTPETHYFEALKRDLEASIPLIWGRSIQTIFFGGGTPSLFSPAFYEKLMGTLRAFLTLKPGLEVTLEANPGTLEHGQFQAYREAGISRVSLGVQSFQSEKLKALGRIHGPDEVFKAVEDLQSAGLHTWNIDLMHGLPGQTPEDALFDLNTALSLDPPHVSWYQLTLEPNTGFAVKPPVLPDEDTLDMIEQAGYAVLASKGLTRYEISAYAKPGHEAQHNVNYWEFGDYLGLGAGAHGKITVLHNLDILRTVKEKSPGRYMDPHSHQCTETMTVTPDQRPFEFMLNACRLVNGFTIRDFEERTGLSISRLERPLSTALSKGLLTQLSEETPGYRPTALGIRFYNDLIGLFDGSF